MHTKLTQSVTSGLVAAVAAMALLILGATPLAVGLFMPPWDKAVHFAAYFAIGCLIALGFSRRRPLLGLTLTIILGAIDESLQLFEPGRSPELADLIADIAGALGSSLFADRVTFTTDLS